MLTKQITGLQAMQVFVDQHHKKCAQQEKLSLLQSRLICFGP
jgi:hypothetical protein